MDDITGLHSAIMWHPLHQTRNRWATHADDPDLAQNEINVGLDPYLPYFVLQGTGPTVPVETLTHQGVQNPSLAEDGLAVMPGFYHPYVVLQSTESVIPVETLALQGFHEPSLIKPSYSARDLSTLCCATERQACGTI